MESDSSMVGVGCFADERTVARALRRAVEHYLLGSWEPAAAGGFGAVGEGRLLERLCGAAAPAPAERITGFLLAFRGSRLHLRLYSRGGARPRRTYRLDELADLRRKRMH
jgi:hypothetical protein